jgi:hypothetical protein
MLEELDGSLRDFLRADVPLRADDVDIDFSMPDKEWSSRLSRSTVNLFLFDIRRSTSRAVSGRSTRERDGVLERLHRTPMIRMRYMVTVWTAEAADEHRVLGDVLRLLAVSGDIPERYLVGDLVELGQPVELAIGSEDGQRPTDLWSSLGVAARANIELMVTMPARPPLALPVAVPPTEIDSTVADRRAPTQTSRRRAALIEENVGRGGQGDGG